MTRLSSWVLCSKWLSPPKRFFGVFPKQFFTLVSQSPAFFWANGCCFRKGSVEGPAKNSLHLSPKWLLLHKNSLEGSANCALHLSPSLLLGPKLRELLTCLTHTNPVRRKWPIMSLLLGYSLGLSMFGMRAQCFLWKSAQATPIWTRVVLPFCALSTGGVLWGGGGSWDACSSHGKPQDKPLDLGFKDDNWLLAFKPVGLKTS